VGDEAPFGQGETDIGDFVVVGAVWRWGIFVDVATAVVVVVAVLWIAAPGSSSERRRVAVFRFLSTSSSLCAERESLWRREPGDEEERRWFWLGKRPL